MNRVHESLKDPLRYSKKLQNEARKHVSMRIKLNFIGKWAKTDTNFTEAFRRFRSTANKNLSVVNCSKRICRV